MYQSFIKILFVPRNAKNVSKWMYLSSSFSNRLGSVQNTLRPFYFKIHPDFFGQLPNQQITNEQSLKLLNSYLETVTKGEKTKPVTLNFFVRNDQKPDEPSNKVSIYLDNDLEASLKRILQICGISDASKLRSKSLDPKVSFDADVHYHAWKNYNFESKNIDIYSWIKDNWKKSQEAAVSFMALEMEIDKVKQALCKHLNIRDIVWDCGWNLIHYRGCLLSFQNLMEHYEGELEHLKGKTLVFGRDSGVSLEGHVILNTGEVRRNWLDLLKNIPSHELILEKIPKIEKSLSGLLGNIQIMHRNYEPVKLVSLYETRLKRLITILSDFRGYNNYPARLPDLSNLELVVEAEACPLMLSPVGQFIVPSTCHAALLIKYLIENQIHAEGLLKKHRSLSLAEADTMRQCMASFNMRSLKKAGNITPEQMIECCRRLISLVELKPMLYGSRLYISNHYSLHDGGIFCIPWDFMSD